MAEKYNLEPSPGPNGEPFQELSMSDQIRILRKDHKSAAERLEETSASVQEDRITTEALTAEARRKQELHKTQSNRNLVGRLAQATRSILMPGQAEPKITEDAVRDAQQEALTSSRIDDISERGHRRSRKLYDETLQNAVTHFEDNKDYYLLDAYNEDIDRTLEKE